MDVDPDLARAAELIRAGRLVAFPTETVYGLGANALDAAVRAHLRGEGTPADQPADRSCGFDRDGARACRDWPDDADRLARHATGRVR